MKLATKVGFEVYMTLLRWQVNVRRRWREKGMLGKRKNFFLRKKPKKKKKKKKKNQKKKNQKIKNEK